MKGRGKSFISNSLALGRIFFTAHPIINLIDSIKNAFHQNKFACRVFIDLKKEFDTVDHEILLKNLWDYGIRGIANDWFKSYLTNRMQYVSINNILFQLITGKDNAAQETLVTQYYAQIFGLSEGQQHKAFYITELSLNSCGIRAQLLWLEMALFSKKALHNIERHS